jgi:hypothetical protein
MQGVFASKFVLGFKSKFARGIYRKLPKAKPNHIVTNQLTYVGAKHCSNGFLPGYPMIFDVDADVDVDDDDDDDDDDEDDEDDEDYEDYEYDEYYEYGNGYLFHLRREMFISFLNPKRNPHCGMVHCSTGLGDFKSSSTQDHCFV